MSFRNNEQDPINNGFDKNDTEDRHDHHEHHEDYDDGYYMGMPCQQYLMSYCPYMQTCPMKESCPIVTEYKKMYGYNVEELKIMQGQYRDDPDPQYRPYYRPRMHYHMHYHHHYFHHIYPPMHYHGYMGR